MTAFTILSSMVCYIYTIYAYCGKLLNWFVRAFETGMEKRALGELFFFVSQRLHIHFIFTNTVRILCSSCNLKKYKTTANFIANSHRINRHYNRFIGGPVPSALFCRARNHSSSCISFFKYCSFVIFLIHFSHVNVHVLMIDRYVWNI